MQLLSGEQYFDQLCQAITQAKERVIVAAMIVLFAGKTERLALLLQAAAARGVRVHVVVDHYITSPYSREKGLSASQYQQLVAQTKTGLQVLQAAGGRVSWVGKQGLNPFKGRMHAKYTVIDNTVYSFGGINCTENSFAVVDFMLKHSNKALATTLEQLASQTAKGLGAHDLQFEFDHGTMLFDVGRPGQSIIYERACDLASAAQNIYFVSQMPPSGRLVRLLKARKYRAYFNHPKQSYGFNALGIWLDTITSGVKNSYTSDTYLHAKYILFEMPNGERQLITGSNNFSWRGVQFGTTEIALQSSDSELWELLYKFLQAQVITSR